MAVNYSTAVKNSRMAVVRDAIDGGAGPGTLEICTAAYASVLVTVTFDDPCGNVSSGVLTFSATPLSATAANTGTAAIARIKDSTGTVVCDGLTVATGGADITVNTTSVTSGASVSVTSATITHG